VVNRLPRYAALFALLFVLPVLVGNAWGADDFEALRNSARKIKTLRAEFVLEKHLRIMAKPLVSRGLLSYKAPRSIRWEYLSPVKHLMLMNAAGTKAYLWSEGKWAPDQGQSEARAAVMNEMNAWLMGSFGETSAFHAAYRPGPPPTVTLTPKEGMERFITKIVFGFSPTTGLVRTVEIVEDQGNHTKITFRNEKVDADLAESIFETP
jgi:outer membrane lipoprotein carrier protein